MDSLTKKLKAYKFKKELINKVPRQPGVYIFYNEENTVLYVGKSISLKNRLVSYLGNDLGTKTDEMVSQIKCFSFILVNSEVESLLLEAFLVKKYMPKYNISLKDDKSPLYIVIVQESLPWITIARRSQLSHFKKAMIYGPFISKQKVDIVLSTMRRIFPFAKHKPSQKPCFDSHIGLCNPCPSIITFTQDAEKKDQLIKIYKRNFSFLRKALNGQTKALKRSLITSMDKSTKLLRYEESLYYKNKLEAFEYVTANPQKPGSYYERPTLLQDIVNDELIGLKNFISKYIKITKLHRIECYDVAHLAGNFPTASMVTFTNGVSDKTLYRHFRIRQKKGNSDTDSLSEVAKRRFNNLKKWGKPDLIIVDGGKGQVSKFFDVFKTTDIAVVGIAKREEQMVFILPNRVFKTVKITKGPALFLVQKLRNEAHRFARRYHHKLFSKSFLPLNIN